MKKDTLLYIVLGIGLMMTATSNNDGSVCWLTMVGVAMVAAVAVIMARDERKERKGKNDIDDINE